jgi:opacity protein-like surface antigen
MRRLILLTVLAFGASAARAESGLFYLGAGITSNHVNSTGVPGYGDIYPGINSTSWKVFAGIRPIRLFAVEADYLDLGSHTNTQGTPMSCEFGSCSVAHASEAKAFAGYAMGFLPMPLPYLDVYGKAGVARFKLNRTFTSYDSGGTSNGSSAFPDDGNVFTWGAGVQAHIGIIGGRLEYEGFNKASASAISLSVFLNLK